MSINLFYFREFRNWQPENVAKGLEISAEEYKNLEVGLNAVDAETALKLSQLYQAPPQLFLIHNSSPHSSVIYTHCNFENSSGYVNHLYQNDQLVAVKNEEIKLLKDEVMRLQKQNDQLLHSILSKK